MTSNEQRMHDLIAEQAAEWLVENRDGLDGQQRAAFSAWLRMSPRHVQEYLAIAALARDLPAAAQSVNESVEALTAHARQNEDATIHVLKPSAPAVRLRPAPRRWRVWTAAAAVAVLAIGLMTVGRSWLGSRGGAEGAVTVQRFATGHGEMQTHRLPDQSVLHLNTDSALTVRFDAGERLIVLERGEADFEVAHEANRHFRVTAGAAQVTAVGTRFDVRLATASTLVTVAQGRVQIGLGARESRSADVRELGAGQQIRVAADAWPVGAIAVDVERAMGWLQGKLRFDDEPLGRVTNELNRYVPTPFEITTPALQSLKISGVFATDDPQAFIAFLRSLPGVKVTATASRILVSQS